MFIAANHKADTSSNAKNDAREMGSFDCATTAIHGFYANEIDFNRPFIGYFRGMWCFKLDDIN